MFENLLSWLLLPLGVVLGLNLARNRQSGSGSGPNAGKAGASGMMAGAQNSDDRAIDAMSSARGSETADAGVIELQMTLGSLFRKRGEVERAIHLHQAVLARPSLTLDEAAQARHELAQDYLRAGLMDSAESLLQALVAGGELLGPSLDLLLEVYEQGRDWPQAIVTARRLEGVRGGSEAARIGQYHCELADNAMHAGDLVEAQREAERALDTHRDCARASLLLAGLAEKRQEWPAAIRALSRAIEQDKRYLPEALLPLKRCFEAAGRPDDYRQFLDDAELDHPDSFDITLAKAQAMRAVGMDNQRYLADRLAKKPDWRGLMLWLQETESALPRKDGDAETAVKVQEVFRKRLEARARYTCSSCGLTPSVLFWQCPNCKHWATIAPAPALI